MDTKLFLSWLLMFFLLMSVVDGMIQGLYCGQDNCYDLLGITRDTSKSELTRAYRKLAKKWHPDMHKKKADKEKAEQMFRRIATAYETLKDEETRRDYDYMLDNPDEYYSHYFYYYRRRIQPKVDVRIVIAVTITILSVIQYWSAWNNYNAAISYLVTVPKYRLQATSIAKSEGLLDNKKRKDRSKTKEEIREEEEAILKKVLQEKMDIRGGYRKPSPFDVLWMQLILSPYYLAKYIYWYLRWLWKFVIKREEYGEEEKTYIIRKYMKLSQGQWDALEDHEQEDFLRKELWKKNKFMVWKQAKEEEMKAELSQNSRYKSYRRYLKKGGPGQISFGPD